MRFDLGKSFGISENVGEKFEIPRHLFTPDFAQGL